MQRGNEIQQGWEFATGIMGANLPADMVKDYVPKVDKAIEELENNINYHKYRNLSVDKLQGYMFEEMISGSFNVDAAASRSSYRTIVPHSTVKDSPDILILKNDQVVGAASAKSYANGAESAKQQARINPDTHQASYQGQKRLVSDGQLSDAKAEAQKQHFRNNSTRPDVSEAYRETEEKLTDRLNTDDGTRSGKFSREELDQIARESKDQSFKAKDHGITALSAVNVENLMRESLKAGYTAAAVTVAVQLAPEIYKAIDYLIKNGELDIQIIQKIGIKGISAGAEGFLRGFIASALKIICDTGAFGSAFKGINPTALGIIVSIVMQTTKNSILVAAGKMSGREMGVAFVDSILIAGGYAGGYALGSYIGGIIGQAIGFELPVLGYLLGSLIGASVCVIYNIGKKKLISFCVDTGFTCFGLVEQNYELPEEVLHEIGIETIPILRTQVEHTDVSRTKVFGTGIETSEYETINITVLRRGVIGVNKVGYVLT